MSTLLLLALKLLVLSTANSASERGRVADEMPPVKIEHSRSYEDKEENNATYAIDLKLDTTSVTEKGSDGKTWLKVTLDKVYGVRQVVEYNMFGSPRTTWDCSITDCSACVGHYCRDIALTVSAEGEASDNIPPVSDSKLGNTVKLERTDNYPKFTLYEISVTVTENLEVEAKSKEVHVGTDTTISCVITGITATATVSWRTSSGEVTGNDYVPSRGTQSGGTQTSTLLVKGAKVTADTAYTCRVTSGSLPDSGHNDTTVNLNVYEVEAKGKEVHVGTDTTISCVITGITATATVSWRTSSGEVTGNDYVPSQGTESGGTQTSTLLVKGAKVTADAAYTCRVTSGSLSNSDHHDTTVHVYDLLLCEPAISAAECKMRKGISEIAKKAKNITSTEDQIELSEKIRDLTQESSALMNSEDILQTSRRIIDKIIDYTSVTDTEALNEEVRNNILETFDYIHKSTPAKEVSKNDAAHSLRSSVKKLADKILKDTAESENLFKEQTIAVFVKKKTFEYISFAVTGYKEKFNEISVTDNAKDNAPLFSADFQVSEAPLTVIIYNTSKFYPDVNTTEDLTQALAKKFMNLTEAKMGASKVVSVVVEINRQRVSQDKRIEMKFTVDKEEPRVHYKMALKSSYECAFYEEDKDTWITGAESDCIITLEEQSVGNLISCEYECPRTRRTRSNNNPSGVKISFAVLMSFKIKNNYDPREGTVTTVLLGISLVCLLFTIIAYIPVQVEKTMPVRMKLFFVISLIFSIVIFYLMELAVLHEHELKKMDKPSENEPASVPCLVIAFLMNYFWLCQMAWMVCWAVVLHRMVTKVFNCLHISRYMLKFNLPCWGIPLIFPTIGMILGQVTKDGFANPKTCFVRENYGLGTFYSPVFVCVFFNIVIFMRVSRSLYGPKVRKTRITPVSNMANMKLKEQFIFSVRVMTLLGLSWIFGFFLILKEENVNTTWIRWLFILFNCSQGTFIFILDVVLNENLRKVWRRLLHKFWPFEMDISPITRVTNIASTSVPSVYRVTSVSQLTLAPPVTRVTSIPDTLNRLTPAPPLTDRATIPDPVTRVTPVTRETSVPPVDRLTSVPWPSFPPPDKLPLFPTVN